jgi:hypothetical protein
MKRILVSTMGIGQKVRDVVLRQEVFSADEVAILSLESFAQMRAEESDALVDQATGSHEHDGTRLRFERLRARLVPPGWLGRLSVRTAPEY